MSACGAQLGLLAYRSILYFRLSPPYFGMEMRTKYGHTHTCRVILTQLSEYGLQQGSPTTYLAIPYVFRIRIQSVLFFLISPGRGFYETVLCLETFTALHPTRCVVLA